ncbi:hypothetical protein L596_018165 [Steinernema carpocapsae]|uniref:Uncharacterized protein n=1 Tax=Steinernema carpocapsae TaxID=34508 RepID=A0A4U5N4K4_STECR|nr:hypothetical protein L596_018165 [Steinernema carpocapsae]
MEPEINLESIKARLAELDREAKAIFTLYEVTSAKPKPTFALIKQDRRPTLEERKKSDEKSIYVRKVP